MTSSTAVPPPRQAAPGAPGPVAGPPLLVMPLRAAEEHVLVVVGEADLSTAGRLREHLTAALAERPPALRVELGGLDFCDLSGLDALHHAAHAAVDADVPLTFTGMSAQLAWLHGVFPPTRLPAGAATARPGAAHAAAR